MDNTHEAQGTHGADGRRFPLIEATALLKKNSVGITSCALSWLDTF